MLNQILSYCEKQNIKCIFLDFFGTIVQRKCGPQEVKLLWAKKLSCKIKYTFDEKQLALLRTKSEQAAISRAENGEFNYTELADEIYRRAVELNRSFGDTYSLEEFYKQALTAEVEAELESQSYIQETIQLIDEAYDLGVNMYIISDFYLSKEELKTFLKRDRIDEKIDQIFVSSDYRNSKQQGGLYDCVCQTLGVNKDQCVMLGDNENSDVKNAEKSGIKGFLLNNSEGVYTKDNVKEKIKKIAKSNLKGVLGYSNYSFLLYLHIERLYKSLIREGIKDIYFLSREGEFLKKLFDCYLYKRANSEIRSHYLYVSRKATYPATLKSLKEERFELLRKFSELSLNDFFENLGMSAVITERHLNLGDINKPIKDFFNSKEFYSLCADEEFQRIYEESRSNYISLFRKYCKQEGILPSHKIAIADVGWNGTMQDNILKALGNVNCIGLYIGLINKAYTSEKNKKLGLIFSENPLDTPDINLWKYDHIFMERILWASHGATDHYEKNADNNVVPVLKSYSSESENYKLMKPVQEVILDKFKKLDDILGSSCYCTEAFYKEFLDIHKRMLFIVNNQQLELQRKMIKGQMQNFGHLTSAGNSIGTTFSVGRIMKKIWSNLRLFKNTEIMFRILINYNRKNIIRVLYGIRYLFMREIK